jgi:hypothetical protein
MASNDASYLRLLPFVKGFENVADALGLDLNGSSLRQRSKNFAAVAARQNLGVRSKNPSQLDTYSNIMAVLRIPSTKSLVLQDRVKRRVGGALMAEICPVINPWEKKPYNPRKIAKRLLSCQASWMVLRQKSTNEISLLPNFCNAAPCPFCSRRKSARLLDRALKKFERMAHQIDLRWITLTITNPPYGSLAPMIKKMLDAFTEIRRARCTWSLWSSLVCGYLWNLEITINPRARSWHPHIHILFDGSYFPLESLQASWQRAMGSTVSTARVGDCYIKIDGKKVPLSQAPKTEIRHHPDTNDPILFDLTAQNLLSVISETTKYSLAPFETQNVAQSEIRELMAALHNKRLKGSGGTFLIPAAENLHLFQNLGGLQAVLNPKHPKFVDDDTLFEKIISYAQAKPILWFNLVRFWEPAYWIEKANHQPGAQNRAIS